MAEKKPPRFFHGTSADLEPGAVLQPGSVLGRQTWPDKENHSVFMVRTAAAAKKWGGNAAKNHGADTAHVYEVEPLGPVDKRRTPWEGDEHLTSAARVVRKVSSHKVLNPGREEGVFGDVPAQLAPIPKAVQEHVARSPGQRGLFTVASLGKPTAAALATAKAETERYAPAPEQPTAPLGVRPTHSRQSGAADWAAYDRDKADHRRYMGMPS